MSSFYTDVSIDKSNILLRGYKDGKRIKERIKYNPYLFQNSNKPNTEYKTLEGKSVEKVSFKSPWDAHQFIRNNEDTSNNELYGMTNWEYVYINDNYQGQIDFDYNLLNVVTIDIETSSIGGYGNVLTANQPITQITLRKKGKSISFGVKPVIPAEGDIYINSDTEYEMLEKFLLIWNSKAWSPDILTGYNIEFFDVPYIVNRIRKVLGEEKLKALSPWGLLKESSVTIYGKPRQIYFPVGIQIIDYYKLYRKYALEKLEKYTLDFVSQHVLKVGKKDYSEYRNLDDLYERNPQLYYEYNVQDCALIEQLEQSEGMIKLLLTIAYITKVNYVDVFGTIRPWDGLTHSYLMDRKIVVPMMGRSIKEEFKGGFCKEVIPGRYEWVVTFDFTSLYPHITMFSNISPETYVGRYNFMAIEDILAGGVNKYRKELLENNLSVTANMCLYDRSKRGFIPEIMEHIFNERVRYKTEMKKGQKELQKAFDADLNIKVEKYSKTEYALKILLNSGYGAIANRYFRFYSLANAEAITTTGQLTFKWVERDVNKYLNGLLKTEGIDFVVAGDTDSIMLNFGQFFDNMKISETDKNKLIDTIDNICKVGVSKVIDKSCEDLKEYLNAYAQKLSMKREAIADVGIWRKKKNYVLNVWDSEGLRFKEPKMKIKGLEIVKTNSPMMVRTALQDCLKIIVDDDYEKLMKYISEFKNKFIGRTFEEVASPTSVNNLEKYADLDLTYRKGTPRHVKGSLTFNALLEEMDLTNKYPPVYSGDKIKFVSLRLPNPSGDDVISCVNELPPEFDLDRFIDYDAQYQKVFIEPLKSLTDIVGWNMERKNTLNSFF